MRSILLFISFLILGSVLQSHASWRREDSVRLIQEMEKAYARVQDYRALLVIQGFGRESRFQSEHRVLYTFKRPHRIRVDFIAPHEGMVIIYPSETGKVLVRPAFLGSLFTLNLSPYNSLLEVSPGQQIHQTDLGMLIRNISQSLTNMFLGQLSVHRGGDLTVVDVLSDNPFQRGTPTRYIFEIDNHLLLPVKVTEMSPRGDLLRTVSYQDLRLNQGIPDSVFRLD